MSNLSYLPGTQHAEETLAALIVAYWRQKDTLREFITQAGEAVVAFRQVSWALADAELAQAMALATDLPIEPLGYRLPTLLADEKLAERTVLKVLSTVSDSAQVDAAFKQSVDAGVTLRDELQSKRLDTFTRSVVTDSYRVSQGTGVAAWSAGGLVEGYERHTQANCCPWCASLAKGVWPGDAAFPMHPNDHCTRVPVMVPLDQIHSRWRNGYAARLARQSTAGAASERTFVDWVQPVQPAA